MDTSTNKYHPWGHSQTIYKDDTSWTRALTIYGCEGLSLHYHEFRTETWFPLDPGLRGIINGHPSIDLLVGSLYSVSENVLHRIINPTVEPRRLISVAQGAVDENDIIRIYNKYRE